MTTPWDAAYAAGLIDGEGCIGSHRRRARLSERTYYTARVQIGMTLPGLAALQYMQERWAGSLTMTRRETTEWTEAWTWSLQGPAVLELLESVIPYLRVKAEQARTAIAMETFKRSLPTQPNGRPIWTADAEMTCDLLKHRLHELNQKGPRALSVEA